MNLNDITRGITRYWWFPLLTGLLSIGIGIWCLMYAIGFYPIFVAVNSICEASFSDIR